MRAIRLHVCVDRRLHSGLRGAPLALPCSRLARIACLTLALLLSVACSQRGAYEAVQQNRLNACNNEPTPELRADCRARNSASFEEYQHARAEVLAEEMPDAE